MSARSRLSPGGISPVLQSPIDRGDRDRERDRERERERDRDVRMDAVPPRPLNTHASLLHMQQQNQTHKVGSPIDDPMRDEQRQGQGHAQTHSGGYVSYAQKDALLGGSPVSRQGGAPHPHSLGSLLNHAPPKQHHPQQQQHSRSHSPVSVGGGGAGSLQQQQGHQSQGHHHARGSPPRGSNSKQLHLSPVVHPPHGGYSVHPRSSASSPRSVIDVDQEYAYDEEMGAGGSPHNAREQEARDQERTGERERGVM